MPHIQPDVIDAKIHGSDIRSDILSDITYSSWFLLDPDRFQFIRSCSAPYIPCIDAEAL